MDDDIGLIVLDDGTTYAVVMDAEECVVDAVKMPAVRQMLACQQPKTRAKALRAVWERGYNVGSEGGTP